MAGPGGEVSENGSSGRRPGALPDSADPTDIAMGAVSKDASLDNPARRLLTQQAALVSGQRRLIGTEFRHRRLQLLAERIGLAFKATLIAAFLLLLLLLAWMIVTAMRSEQVVVEPFGVPEALAQNGASGAVVANMMVDELARLQVATRADAQRRSIGKAWSSQIKVEVPEAGPSVGELRRLLAAKLGNDRRIGGDVTRTDDGTLRLTARGDGIPAKSFSGGMDELPALTRRAAEYVYGSAAPALLLLHLNETARGAEAIRFAPQALQAARNDDVRSMVAARWAEALAGQERYEEARERARIAISLNPSNWAAHGILIGATTDEEDALAASGALRRRVEAMAWRRRPGETVYLREHLLRQDWTRLRDIYLREARETARQGPRAFSAGPSLAEAEAQRHDHQAARRHLIAADPGDPIVRPAQDFTAGLRELDLGRADRSVAPLERFHRAMMSNKELRHLFRGSQCYLALAYARLGRSKDALRVLDAEPRSSRCRAFRGDVLALAGDWPAAAEAYRTAIRRAPSLPIPYERAGAALLARDEAAAAVRLFSASIARAPRWADPRFGLAEALMRLGRFEEAERQYREAARFAPRWGALHMGWGEALWRRGRQAEAREKFAAAAGMDLSAANRARLRQLATNG